MPNDLFDKDKKPNLPAQEVAGSKQSADGATAPATAAPATGTPNTGLDFNAIGAYGQNHPLATGSYVREWEKKEKEGVPWTDHRANRIAIRTFSRGIMGAAFFAGGGMLARHWMTPQGARKGYSVAKGFFEQKNPLQFIAKLIDTVVGKPIEMAFGENATRFRPTYFARFDKTGKNKILGRTLGDEVVHVTFDFFCASIGDAWGRDIAGWFDPAVKKEWLVDDGKGHQRIDFPKTLHSTLDSLTRYVTYNGGEDWAVAIPYVYFMKGQRAVLNKFSPGFKYDFDMNINGGSFKLGKNPATGQHEVTGNYNRVGMIDLQTRFTVYNVGTLMFREIYDHFKHVLHGRPDHLYGAADRPTNEKGIIGNTAYVMKWMARSAVKGVMCMTPAVPFFWVTRTPQSKHKGAFINPDEGMLTHPYRGTTGHSRRAVRANELRSGSVTAGESFVYSKLDETTNKWARPKVSSSLLQPVQEGRRFNAYAQGQNMFDNVTDGIGQVNTALAGGLDRPTSRGVFMPTMIYASLSYTPYMIAKAETALMWDSGKMDMAAERMIDGISKLNLGEFQAGAGEVWRTFQNKPLKDPAREAEGERRLLLDRAPTDIFNKTGAQMKLERIKAHEKNQTRWQDRIIGLTPTDKTPRPAGGDGASLPDTYNIAKRANYKDEEEKAKVLRETDPPSKSVH